MSTGSVVFFHAHPDDEAIFTGGTMIALAEGGWRVVLVVATQGELGNASEALAAGPSLAAHRAAETRRAADLLGVARVEFLGYQDSGMLGDPANSAPGAFWSTATEAVAADVAALLREERAVALVVYDERGIYGHPDHVKVHQVGVQAATQAGTATVYEATVDREYLHFVETHLVAEARGAGLPLGLAASPLGVPTVMVSTTVDVRRALDAKRAAMAAHSSQIPETASAMRLPTEEFAAVYGYEWYLRHGPAGPIEAL
ncbi:MAG: PIG-L family deacetylase [Acidimicrobiales bacterium]